MPWISQKVAIALPAYLANMEWKPMEGFDPANLRKKNYNFLEEKEEEKCLQAKKLFKQIDVAVSDT